MKLKYVFFTVLILVILISVSILIIPKNIVKEKKPLTIIHQTWVGDAPIHLAEELGLFEKYGVDVEIKFVEEPQERRAVLASKKADISLETIDMVVSDIGSGVDLTIVGLLDASLGADGIIATRYITSLKDLEGKTVGAQKGEVPYFLLRYLMEKQGIDKDKVNFVDIFPDDAGAAFLAGKIDAAGTWEPFLSKAKERAGGHVLVSSADAPGIIVDILAVRTDILETKRNEVKAVLMAWYEAVELTNQRNSKEIMASAFGLSLDEFEEFVSGLKWNSLEESKGYFKTKIFEVTETISRIAYNDGIIKQEVNAKIDSSLLEEIQ